MFMNRPDAERGSTRGKQENEYNQAYVEPISAKFADDSSGQWTMKGTDQGCIEAKVMPHYADDSSANFSAKLTDQE